jgi:hypothetical protein
VEIPSVFTEFLCVSSTFRQIISASVSTVIPPRFFNTVRDLLFVNYAAFNDVATDQVELD